MSSGHIAEAASVVKRAAQRHMTSHGLRGNWRVYSKVMDPIRVDPDILGGTPCFGGTRVPIRNLFDAIERGRTLDEFLSSFPTVEREQAVAVLEMAMQRITSTTAPAA